MQLYIVPAFLFMLFGATRIHGVSADEPTPFVCDPNFTKFQIILKTDGYGQETTWILKHTDDGTILDQGLEGNYGPSITDVFPSADEYYCLQDGECYTFTIEDAYCDGICCGWAEGYYQGVLDGVLKFEGAEFGCSESKELCVPSSDDTTTPTASPIATTNPPSYLPSGMYPSSHPCTNSNGTVQLTKKKTTTCAKLEEGSSKKKKKYCKIPDVFQACPGVCNTKCTCTDEKKFKLNGEEKKYKCKKVGKKGQPECSGTVNNKTLVEDVCPKKCDVCF